MTLLRRKSTATAEEFRRHWREIHGEMVLHLPGIQRYVQNDVTDSQPPSEFEGIVELSFSSGEDLRTAFASAAGRALPTDEVNFLSGKIICDGESQDWIARQYDGPTVKVIDAVLLPEAIDGATWWHSCAPGIVERANTLPELVSLTTHRVDSAVNHGAEEARTDRIIALLIFRLKAPNSTDRARNSTSVFAVLDAVERLPKDGVAAVHRFAVDERVLRGLLSGS